MVPARPAATIRARRLAPARAPRRRLAPVLCAAIAAIAGIALLPALRAAETGEGLRQRGEAGYRFRELRPDEADSLGLLPPGGVLVTSVGPGTAADLAGLMTGDIVRSYGLSLVGDGPSLLSASRRYRAGDTVQVGLVRDGAVIQVDLVPRARPFLPPQGIDAEVTAFPAADGTRLRAVLYGPEGRAGARLPALIVAAGQPSAPWASGLTSERVLVGAVSLSSTWPEEGGAIGGALAAAQPAGPAQSAADPMPATNVALDRRLAEAVAEAAARAGMRVLRFDPRGAGESEGLDAPQVDFTTEVDDLRQAIHFLRRRADVDPAAVFLWGHADRATEAALLASSEDLAGMVVSSACGRSELEHRAAIARRQGELRGLSPGAIETQVQDEVALLAAIADGASPEDLRSRPNLGRLVNPAGRVLDDRTVGYWRQRLAVNVGEVYAGVKEPALVIHAVSDPFSFRIDHEEIGRILAASGNRNVEIAELAPQAMAGALVRWMKARLQGT